MFVFFHKEEMIKLGIIYGGISTEHDVSEMSAKSVIDNLDKEKYDIHEIYINKYPKTLLKPTFKVLIPVFSRSAIS